MSLQSFICTNKADPAILLYHTILDHLVCAQAFGVDMILDKYCRSRERVMISLKRRKCESLPRVGAYLGYVGVGQIVGQ